MMNGQNPCVYPNCRDIDGNPELTDQTICPKCRRAFRGLIPRIVKQYALLRLDLPTPAATGGTRVKTSPEPGHPAEWASDTARDIAAKLNETEDALRDHVGLIPAPHPFTSEPGRVEHAYRTLTAHFDALCDSPGAATAAQELHDLHRSIRTRLGETSPRQHLPTPCPDCGLLTLSRFVGFDRSDRITCGNCRCVIRAEHYELYVRGVLTDLLGDTPTVTGD